MTQRWTVQVQFEGTAEEVSRLVEHVSQQRGIREVSARLAHGQPEFETRSE